MVGFDDRLIASRTSWTPPLLPTEERHVLHRTVRPQAGGALSSPGRSRGRLLGRVAVIPLAAWLTATAIVLSSLPASAAPVGLGTATSFAVLAGAGITNTGPTTITGDVGTFPTTSESGFASVTILGTDRTVTRSHRAPRPISSPPMTTPPDGRPPPISRWNWAV